MKEYGMSEMPEVPEVPESSDTTSDDRLWAALGYPIFPVAILVLLMEDKKSQPFIRFHAVQALAVNLIIAVVASVLTVVTLGFFSLCMPLIWFVTFWPAYEAYQGKYLNIPYLTNFLKNQGLV
jgi:uncharacterized membrane protein